MAAIAPSDGDDGEVVASHDGLEGKFDRDIEMGGEDGADAFDDLFAVSLEGIGGVVETVTKEDPYE